MTDEDKIIKHVIKKEVTILKPMKCFENYRIYTKGF